MSASTLEFNLSVPHDARYLAMLRAVVASVARQAGCDEDAADAFSKRVEEAASAAPADTEAMLAVVVRQTGGVIEVQLGSGVSAQALTSGA